MKDSVAPEIVAAPVVNTATAALRLGTSVANLAKLRCVGGGPAFRSAGRRIFYEVAELDRWQMARLSAPRRSTSDTAAA